MHLQGGPHNGDHLDIQTVSGTDVRWACKCHGATYRSTGGVDHSLFYEVSDDVPAAFAKAFAPKDLN